MRLVTWLLLGSAWWPAGGLAFVHAQVGDIIENRQMPTLDGEALPLLGKARVNVFIFFRPGQDHSELLLRRLARSQKEMEGKSVRWVAIVSDRHSRDEIRSVISNNWVQIPVLLDRGDALYGGLGVRLHPVVGITDQDHKLVAYQPFQRLNYVEMIEAQIRHGLGEITDQELEQALAPIRAKKDGEASVAARRFHLAEKLIEKGEADKALPYARGSIELDPSRAEFHQLLGKILAAQGAHAEAVQAFREALELDPDNEAIRQALEASRKLAP